MVLSDGYTIINSKAIMVKDYLKSIGLMMPMFTNPADYIIRLAINPSMMRQDLNHFVLN